MKRQYQNELDQIKLTAESKAALIHSLTARERGSRVRFSHRWTRPVVAAAALICVLGVSVAAVTWVTPVLGEYFQNSTGYQQSSVAVGESITKNGWTMTLTDCVMDEYNLYIGFELTAPEGTVLDWEGGYQFDEWDLTYLGIGASGGIQQLEDDDPTDNSIRFIRDEAFAMREDQSLDGQQIEVTMGGLYHSIWTGEYTYERVYDCEEIWNFPITLSLPEKVIRLEPDLPVTTLGVEATITRVEVTPIGVYVYIEGDALKGHHSWVPKNAPDGWYGCIEYQEITLYLTDGTAIPMTDGLSGSGCSGGTDTSEPGYLYLARRGDTLIDMDLLDHISICGVEISLQ